MDNSDKNKIVEVDEHLYDKWFDIEDEGEDSFFCCIFGGQTGSTTKK